MEGEPALQGWLRSNRLGAYYNGMKQIGFESTSDFGSCTEQDVREIAAMLNMKVGERARLLVAVKQVPGSVVAAPKMVVIDEDESEGLKKLSDIQIEANNEIRKVETRSKEIEKSSADCQRQILVSFEQLIVLIQSRKNILVNEVISQTNKKQKALRNQKKNLINVVRELKEIESICSKMMEETNFSVLATRKIGILENVKNAVQMYKICQNVEPSSLMKFVAEQNQVQKALKEFGCILGSESTAPPEITSVVPSVDTVQIEWSPASTYAEQFGVSLASLEEKCAEDIVTYKTFGKHQTKAVLKVQPETQYLVKIRSSSAVGWGIYSKEIRFQTFPLGFPGSTMLNSANKVILNKFLGGLKATKLLFKASVDGYRAANFHGRCDNQGPTLVVIKRNSSPTIFGGYTPLNWGHKPSGNVNDSQFRSFLFTTNDDKGRPAKYQHQKDRAIYTYHGYGPVFGSGCDLFIPDKFNTSANHYTGNSSYAVPCNTSICGMHKGWSVDDLEVFLVT